jgi:biopolymer transport protein ExbD
MSGFYQKRRKRPELNLVPLVMLIFFAFVTMQFRSATTLNITLPKITTAGKNEFKGRITVEIDETGHLTYNGALVSDEQMLARLKADHGADEDIPVLIKADEKSQLKRIAFVWDSCRQVGLSKVAIQSR